MVFGGFFISGARKIPVVADEGGTPVPVLRITYEGTTFPTGDDIDPLDGNSGITYTRSSAISAKEGSYIGSYVNTGTSDNTIVGSVSYPFTELDSATKTFAFWVYKTDTSLDTMFDTNWSTDGAIMTAIENGTDIYIVRRLNGVSQRTDWSSVVSTNTWYHLIFSLDNDTVVLYVNGTAATPDGGGTFGYQANSSDTLTIGGRDASGSYDLERYIDDFRMYTVALTADQALELYNSYT